MSILLDHRAHKDAFFRSSGQSPLTPEQQEIFKGLSYFDEAPALRIVATLRAIPSPEPIQMKTSTGHIAPFVKVGTVEFALNGTQQCLQLYQADDHDDLFLPFMDATSGKESYGGGRYLDVERRLDGTIILDFNLAYNPYCAFDPAKWSCPLPPLENRLTVRIEAGEKKFHEDETPAKKS
jgi:uncharacterized protein (DUF1684 family)